MNIQLQQFLKTELHNIIQVHGKKSVVKATFKSKEAHHLLENIGKTLNVNQNIFDEMTKFTIKFIYGDKLNKMLAVARALKWNSMKTKSMQRIPPDQDSHDLHVKRVNYQAYVLLNYDKPDPPPSPLNHGWILVEGRCQPLRYLNPPLPKNLSDAAVEQKTTATCDTTDYESDSCSGTESEASTESESDVDL